MQIHIVKEAESLWTLSHQIGMDANNSSQSFRNT